MEAERCAVSKDASLVNFRLGRSLGGLELEEVEGIGAAADEFDAGNHQKKLFSHTVSIVKDSVMVVTGL